MDPFEIRKAALAHAVACAASSGDTYESDVDDILRMAKRFEDYVCTGAVPVADEIETETEMVDA